MQTLRITQFTEGQSEQHRVDISLDGIPPVHSTFAFKLSPQDQEDLRWYLEDYLQYPLDPAPIIAARIEKRIEGIGLEFRVAKFRTCFVRNEIEP